MALTLDLSYSERNDNCVLTFTDTTANWGAPNIAVTDVTAAKLDITITTADNTETVYDQIDLVAEFGDGAAPEFNNQAAMVFAIDATLLTVSGAAYGTVDDELPDGLWEIVYTINVVNTLSETILVDGVVRYETYELLRVIPTLYNCTECKSKTILDAILCYGYLNVLNSDAYIAKTEELLSTLYTLERLIDDGSSYTW